MKETLSITQMIAQEKILKSKIDAGAFELDLVSYYRKNNPFIGPRTVEEQTKRMKEDFQSFNDLLTRYYAIKQAHCRANKETMVTVPVMYTLNDFVKKNPIMATETISIAEAISRKHMLKTSTGDGLIWQSKQLLKLSTEQMSKKTALDNVVDKDIKEQLKNRFPPESKNSWSQERYNDIKKQLEEENAVMRLDPFNIAENDAIKKYADYLQQTYEDIIIILSQVNASTFIEFEY